MGFFNLFHALNVSLPLSDILCLPIAAFMVGIGYYLCIKAKSSTVGFDVLALILHEKNETFSIAKMMRAINVSVILLGLLSYGFISIVMGMLFTIIQTKILDIFLNMNVNPKTERTMI